MRVFVTGANGFVGRHLVRELRERHEVLSRMDNPDLVIHAGARVGRERCERDKDDAIATNVTATLTLAETCARTRTSMLYVSSAEAEQPSNIYALTKRWAEDACRLVMPAEYLTIARLGAQYGPGARLGCDTLCNFLQAAMANEELHVYRDTYRTWTYVADSARALALIAESALGWREHGKHSVEPALFNVDSGERHELAEVASAVVSLVGAGRMIEMSAPVGYSYLPAPDTTSLRDFGWRPQVTFAEGLAITHTWLRESLLVAA